MAPDGSFVGSLQRVETRYAYALFTAFIVAIFFINGAASNAIIVLCFVGAWALLVHEARTGSRQIPVPDWLTIVFLAAIALRLLLPPYGDPDTLPGSAIARALLLAGLYGVVLLAYTRLPFQNLLWVIALAASISTVIAIGVFLTSGDAGNRLSFLGRASHPIIGAGAVAAAVIATASLMTIRTYPRRVYGALAAMGAILLLGIYLTGSRGPILSLAIALAVTPILITRARGWVVVACAFAAWALLTSGVVFEAPIKELLCPVVDLACRPSMRHDVWIASLHSIAEHPLWGAGYRFRFEGVPHAHNSYFGLALHYGIPLALLFVALMVSALLRAAKLESKQEKLFVIATLIFANGFMGSDLSDPLRFINTHYLFLWMPLFLAMVGTKRDDEITSSPRIFPNAARRDMRGQD